VRISQDVWLEEVERLGMRSPGRLAAGRERARLESAGTDLAQLGACSEVGADGTQLNGLYKIYIPSVKTYVPIKADPASARPYGFVLSPEHGEQGPYLELLAYGERHPRKGARSVSERAHRRLHGRYPDP
jgi:hypothetical protein